MEVKHRTARFLVGKLSSVSEQTRVEALCELRLMSKNDAESRPLIAEAGAIPYLSETLYSSSPATQENAAATLLNLSISSRESLMSTRGLLDALSDVLRHHDSSSSASAVQSCAATLHSLLVVDEYRPIIGSKRDIVYALVDIIKKPKSPPRSIKDALKAMFGIALYPLNRNTMIQLGAVPPLFSLVVKDGRVGIVEDVTAVIAQIAGCEDSEEAFRKVSGVEVLVDLLDLATGSSIRTKENAVSALLNLVRCAGERVTSDVRDVGYGALDGIADVAENGSAKGKSKAVSLLKVLIHRVFDTQIAKEGKEMILVVTCQTCFFPPAQGSHFNSSLCITRDSLCLVVRTNLPPYINRPKIHQDRLQYAFGDCLIVTLVDHYHTGSTTLWITFCRCGWSSNACLPSLNLVLSLDCFG